MGPLAGVFVIGTMSYKLRIRSRIHHGKYEGPHTQDRYRVLWEPP